MISDKIKALKWGAKVLDQISADLQKDLPGLKDFSSGRPSCTIFELIYHGFTTIGKYCCLISSTLGCEGKQLIVKQNHSNYEPKNRLCAFKKWKERQPFRMSPIYQGVYFENSGMMT